MKLRVWTLSASVVLLVGAASVPPSADAAPPPLLPALPVLAPMYVQREVTAPAPIKARLAQLRQAIQANNASYTVGYTSAMDRPLSQLTGVSLPADYAQQATAMLPVQNALLQADQQARAQYQLAHPTWTPPPGPPFGVWSPRADWRTVGVVPPIRDQGNCPSCWAFAIMGAYSSSRLIRTGGVLPVTPSEQSMMSCANAWSQMGVDLAWLTAVGAQRDSEYAYAGTDGCAVVPACKTPYVPDVRAAGWGYITQNWALPTVAQLKQAIVQYGPVIVSVNANGYFQAYSGGVFFEDDSHVVDAQGHPYLDHVVVVVGWDDSQVSSGGTGAWIVRNSWGTTWGETAGYGTETGYMYLGYGSSNVGSMSEWVMAPAIYGVSSTAATIMNGYRQTVLPVPGVLVPPPTVNTTVAH